MLSLDKQQESEEDALSTTEILVEGSLLSTNTQLLPTLWSPFLLHPAAGAPDFSLF